MESATSVTEATAEPAAAVVAGLGSHAMSLDCLSDLTGLLCQCVGYTLGLPGLLEKREGR